MPKSIYEIEIGGERFEVEADSPAAAAEAAKQHPLYKATKGMKTQDRTDDPGHQGNLMDTGVALFQGAGERIGKMAEGIGQIPAMVKSNVKAFKDGPKAELAAYPGRAVRGVEEILGSVKDTAMDAVSGNPRRTGSAVVDIAAMTPLMKIMGEGGMTALRAGGRAAAAASETSPTAAALTGESGIAARLRRLAELRADPNIVNRPLAESSGRDFVLTGARVEPPKPPIVMSPEADALRAMTETRPDVRTSTVSRMRGGDPIANPSPPTVSVSPEADALRAAMGEQSGPASVMRTRGGGPVASPSPEAPVLSSPEADTLRQALAVEGTPPPSSVLDLGSARGGDPIVSESPAALKAKAVKSTKTPTTVEDVEQLYRELSRKPFLSYEESQIMQRLEPLMLKRAREVGMGHAARGTK